MLRRQVAGPTLLAWTLVAFVGATGIFLSAAPGLPEALLPVVIGAVIALSVRCAISGIYISSTEVVVRDWIRTRRIPIVGVVDITAEPYSGFISWYGQTRLLSVVVVRSGSGDMHPCRTAVSIPPVARRLAARCATRLRTTRGQ